MDRAIQGCKAFPELTRNISYKGRARGLLEDTRCAPPVHRSSRAFQLSVPMYLLGAMSQCVLARFFRRWFVDRPYLLPREFSGAERLHPDPRSHLQLVCSPATRVCGQCEIATPRANCSLMAATVRSPPAVLNRGASPIKNACLPIGFRGTLYEDFALYRPGARVCSLQWLFGNCSGKHGVRYHRRHPRQRGANRISVPAFSQHKHMRIRSGRFHGLLH